MNSAEHPADAAGGHLGRRRCDRCRVATRHEPDTEMHFAAWRARGVDRGQADAVLLEHIQQLTQRTGPVFW
ncbi:hypothetical protein G6F65_023048 [Rhizopus arrhizus]|nr:hypothetical protein G6F65_023048 [Rhizopus arrhizus]